MPWTSIEAYFSILQSFPRLFQNLKYHVYTDDFQIIDVQPWLLFETLIYNALLVISIWISNRILACTWLKPNSWFFPPNPLLLHHYWLNFLFSKCRTYLWFFSSSFLISNSLLVRPVFKYTPHPSTSLNPLWTAHFIFLLELLQ